jgi:hypothetical protein
MQIIETLFSYVINPAFRYGPVVVDACAYALEYFGNVPVVIQGAENARKLTQVRAVDMTKFGHLPELNGLNFFAAQGLEDKPSASFLDRIYAANEEDEYNLLKEAHFYRGLSFVKKVSYVAHVTLAIVEMPLYLRISSLAVIALTQGAIAISEFKKADLFACPHASSSSIAEEYLAIKERCIERQIHPSVMQKIMSWISSYGFERKKMLMESYLNKKSNEPFILNLSIDKTRNMKDVLSYHSQRSKLLAAVPPGVLNVHFKDKEDSPVHTHMYISDMGCQVDEIIERKGMQEEKFNINGMYVRDHSDTSLYVLFLRNSWKQEKIRSSDLYMIDFNLKNLLHLNLSERILAVAQKALSQRFFDRTLKIDFKEEFSLDEKRTLIEKGRSDAFDMACKYYRNKFALTSSIAFDMESFNEIVTDDDISNLANAEHNICFRFFQDTMSEFARGWYDNASVVSTLPKEIIYIINIFLERLKSKELEYS